jgi:hypothetical protein
MIKFTPKQNIGLHINSFELNDIVKLVWTHSEETQHNTGSTCLVVKGGVICLYNRNGAPHGGMWCQDGSSWRFELLGHLNYDC